MPKLVYNGPHDEVEVPAAGLVAKRGEPVEVPQELADSLLAQEQIWARAERAPKAETTKAEGGKS